MEARNYKDKNFSVALNGRMRGIELRFEKKMSEDEIADMKDAGFKWSKRQQMWYAYQNEKTIAFANSLIESAEAARKNREEAQARYAAEQSGSEITIEELAALVKQRAELDKRIAEIQKVAVNGKIIDVSSEQAKDLALDIHGIEQDKEEIPNLKTRAYLKEKDIEGIEIVSDEEFNDIVDSIILNDYKNIPNVIRLPNIKAELSKKLGLAENAAFIMKREATHIRPDGKSGYGQALSTEEYRMIPSIMREATFAVIDKRYQNFQIVFDDAEEKTKINKIVFNKDALGNYVVTIGKVDRRDAFSEMQNEVVGVGVAPTISALRSNEEPPATRLRPSPTAYTPSIQQEQKSVNKNLPEKTIEQIERERAANQAVEITEDDLKTAKKFIPTQEYYTMLGRANGGEESDFYKRKIKHVAEMGRILYNNRGGKSYNEETELHDKGFMRYYYGGRDFYICEVDKDGRAFGYTVLNGDTAMSEYGYTMLSEITSLGEGKPGAVELDLYIDDSLPMEHAIRQKYPVLFAEEKEIESEQKIEDEQSLPDYIMSLSAKTMRFMNEGFGKRLSDDQKALQFAALMRGSLSGKGISSLPQDVYTALEDSNYHTENHILGLMGYYGAETQRKEIESYNRYPAGYTAMFNIENKETIYKIAGVEQGEISPSRYDVIATTLFNDLYAGATEDYVEYLRDDIGISDSEMNYLWSGPNTRQTLPQISGERMKELAEMLTAEAAESYGEKFSETMDSLGINEKELEILLHGNNENVQAVAMMEIAPKRYQQIATSLIAELTEGETQDYHAYLMNEVLNVTKGEAVTLGYDDGTTPQAKISGERWKEIAEALVHEAVESYNEYFSETMEELGITEDEVKILLHEEKESGFTVIQKEELSKVLGQINERMELQKIVDGILNDKPLINVEEIRDAWKESDRVSAELFQQVVDIKAKDDFVMDLDPDKENVKIERERIEREFERQHDSKDRIYTKIIDAQEKNVELMHEKIEQLEKIYSSLKVDVLKELHEQEEKALSKLPLTKRVELNGNSVVKKLALEAAIHGKDNMWILERELKRDTHIKAEEFVRDYKKSNMSDIELRQALRQRFAGGRQTPDEYSFDASEAGVTITLKTYNGYKGELENRKTNFTWEQVTEVFKRLVNENKFEFDNRNAETVLEKDKATREPFNYPIENGNATKMPDGGWYNNGYGFDAENAVPYVKIVRNGEKQEERVALEKNKDGDWSYTYNGEAVAPQDDQSRINAMIEREATKAFKPLSDAMQRTLTPTDMKKIREEAKRILSEHTDEEIRANPEMLNLLAKYEGGGGLSNEKERTSAEVLNAFYTPRNVVEAVWKLADHYAPEAKTVLEPSSGIGRFAENRPNNQFTLRELDETSARIAKILHPDAEVVQGAFESQFFDADGRVHLADTELPKYDIVIGNPPYGENKSVWRGRGEGREFARIEEYFLSRGLDSLKDENSVLLYVMPSSFLKSGIDATKRTLAYKGEIIDAYRLPNGAFDSTDVGTDIVVLKKDGSKNNDDWIEKSKDFFGDNWFKAHPEKILGEEYIAKDRWGKDVVMVRPHEGKTLQDELDEIAKQIAQQHPVVKESELPKISYYVRTNSEFDSETVAKNLTAKDAVRMAYELTEQQKGKSFGAVSYGVAMHIPGDLVFDDPEQESGFMVVNNWYNNGAFAVDATIFDQDPEKPAYIAARKELEEALYEISPEYQKKLESEILANNEKLKQKETPTRQISQEDIISDITEYNPAGLEETMQKYQNREVEIKDLGEVVRYAMAQDDSPIMNAVFSHLAQKEIKENFEKNWDDDMKSYWEDYVAAAKQSGYDKPEHYALSTLLEYARKAGAEIGELTGELAMFNTKQIHSLPQEITKENLQGELDKLMQEQQIKTLDVATNFVLEKLSAAGIEVVTDKAEFDKILANTKRLQKMNSIPFEKFTIGQVDDFQLNEAKEAGFDLDGYKHEITNEFIAHVIKQHGNAITEAARGQIAITEKDLKSIGDVISNPDKVVYGTTYKEYVGGNFANRERVVYAKNMPDGTSLYFEEVLSGKRNKTLRGTTLFKRLEEVSDEKLANIIKGTGYKANVDNIKIKVRGGAAISPLTRQPNVDAAAISASGEPNISISEFVDKSIANYVASKKSSKFFIQGNTTYGFAHNGKIYLDPDLMNSEAAVHEYTHLWDEYTRRTNHELWEKGKDIFSRTHLWNEVKEDPNYADIADDDDLVLSECHARICGKIAAQVLERIAEQDGEIAKDAVIDWDKEVNAYIAKELANELEGYGVGIAYKGSGIKVDGREISEDERLVMISKEITDFFSQPMKDLMSGRQITRAIAEENSQAVSVQQNPIAQKKPGDTLTIEEFSRLYGKEFDRIEFDVWKATDWEGKIDVIKLIGPATDRLLESPNYVEAKPGEFTHKALFVSGNIGAKIRYYEETIEKVKNGEKIAFERDGDIFYYKAESIIENYQKNIAILQEALPKPIPMEKLHFGLNTTIAEEFKIPETLSDGDTVDLNLQEKFVLWAHGHNSWQSMVDDSGYHRRYLEWATANVSREEFPDNVDWYDIIEYIDKKPVKADPTHKHYGMTEEDVVAMKAQRKREADEKRMARAETADRLFDRFLHEGLSQEEQNLVEAEYNKRFNSYVAPDYSKLPLFIDGMSAFKDGDRFKLYDQQIKGISFCSNKGNGLLAYDVGVGKTAAGIVLNNNQIQLERSGRPLVVVPNSVYTKWYNDFRELFPNVPVNDLYNLNKESTEKFRDKENPHKLNIPEGSISLVTYEGLKNITFRDETCENELYEDFSRLLSEDIPEGGAEDERNSTQKAKDAGKITNAIGTASQVENSSYVFFEDCGWDNITVDEAHNFKNLWTIPRPKNKGESNEFSGIPTGKPSKRALKLYAMTQYVQKHNDNRNVFLLTATPFTNSPLEVYSMLSYVGRQRLIDSGIYSLRDFLNQFAHTKLEIAVNARGEIDYKQVMKDWKELPALQNILTEFIDKVDGEEAGIIRPKKFTHVKDLDPTDLQKRMIEADTDHMLEIKEGNSAAVIVSMNAMRLALVAPALGDRTRYDFPLPSMEQLVETSPKLKFVCDSIIEMYKTNPEKGQFMYMPLGQQAHGIVKDYLVQHGIPKEAVEVINGSVNNSVEKKEKITSRFNDEKDKLKIIIGGKNTSEGIDLNGNSFVMYNCSLGWNPSETIQAEGRIWRQGNMQGHVHCVYPVMNDSIDSVLYQKHDEKRSRINDLWTYKGDNLNVEDIKPEDLKFDLIKDPRKRAKLVLDEMTKELKAELQKTNTRIESYDEIIEKKVELKEQLEEVQATLASNENLKKKYEKEDLELPPWLKAEIASTKKSIKSAESKMETVQAKLEKLGIHSDEDSAAYIRNMNAQKHTLEKQIEMKQSELPDILKRMKIELMEKKLTLPPVEEQRKDLCADITANLRPMKDVEAEIKQQRFEKTLEDQFQHGEITKEEFDLYKRAGYKNYEKWRAGEIESLENIPEETVETTAEVEFNARNFDEVKKFVEAAGIEAIQKPDGQVVLNGKDGETTVFKQDVVRIKDGTVEVQKPSFLGNQTTTVEPVVLEKTTEKMEILVQTKDGMKPMMEAFADLEKKIDVDIPHDIITKASGGGMDMEITSDARVYLYDSETKQTLAAVSVYSNPTLEGFAKELRALPSLPKKVAEFAEFLESRIVREEKFSEPASAKRPAEHQSSLFEEEYLDSLAAKQNAVPLQENYRLITYSSDSGFAERGEFESSKQANEAGVKFMRDWNLTEEENGFVVYNEEERRIDGGLGMFPREQYFSNEILAANGMASPESGKLETKVSDIAQAVKEKIQERTGASDDWIKNHLIIASAPQPKKQAAGMEY